METLRQPLTEERDLSFIQHTEKRGREPGGAVVLCLGNAQRIEGKEIANPLRFTEKRQREVLEASRLLHQLPHSLKTQTDISNQLTLFCEKEVISTRVNT